MRNDASTGKKFCGASKRTKVKPSRAQNGTGLPAASDADYRAFLADSAREVAALADERRKAKTGPTHRYPPKDVALFDPHVLLEFDSLRLGIDRVDDAAVRRDLELVLSSILIKVSRRASDTSEHTAARRQVYPRADIVCAADADILNGK